ncbi:MAG: SIMPL domain-containing protein [Lachnospirales bacterium]
MKFKKLFIGTLVASMLMAQSIFASTTLTVNGAYEAKTEANAGNILFDLTVKGETASESRTAAIKELNVIVEKLLATNYGLTKEDIVLTSQNTWESYDYLPVEPMLVEDSMATIAYEENYGVVGYETYLSVAVNVDDIDKVSDVYDFILASSDKVTGAWVDYVLEDDDATYYDALDKAIDEAYENGEKLGKRLFPGKAFKVVSVTEASTNYSYSTYYGAPIKIENSAPGTIGATLPDVTTYANVIVTFEFED